MNSPSLPPSTCIRIGTAGWSIPRASAAAFPGIGSHLERYSRALPCAEINSNFSRSPRASTYARWISSVPEYFRFSVKAPRAITHEAALAAAPAHLQAFLDQARSLSAKLGPILFQLPPGLAFDPTRAELFFTTLRNLYSGPVVVEPRHPSWFEPTPNSLLNRLQIARAAADPARVPSAASPGASPAHVYFRLHGSPRTYYSSYSDEFLSDLAAKLASHTPTAAEVWCIFDNTASGAAAADALRLSDNLRSKNLL